MHNSEDKETGGVDGKKTEEKERTGGMEKIERSLEAAKKEAEENLAGWQRAKADFLNFKKGQEKSLADFRKYAGEDLILKLLPTIDSFDLATRHLPEELKDSDWVRGVLCIKGMFENFLREAGVSEIKALGEDFDPTMHEAVGEEESDEEAGTVVEEVQKGYKMDDKVIRVAKVKIAK